MGKQHVLIVDDSPVQLRTVINFLKTGNYEVSVACDGQEGIAAAKARRPDIILMDLVMPGMNGFQATRQLTRCEETAHIPVIVCSSKSAESDRKWALRQGAKDYLVKPLQQQNLLATINRELNGATTGAVVGVKRYEHPV